MKKVLVLYFSQSGQLREILESMLKPLTGQASIQLVWREIHMQKPFPFPWSTLTFLDAMPESVLEIPSATDDPDIAAEAPYDLVILGYQPWFLSTSVPISSFLQSKYAAVLKDTPVVTVIGSRNMWLMAQERIKKHLTRLGAKLVLNVPFIDRAPNSLSVISIPLWMLTGKRQPLKLLPRAGVSETDIAAASKHGEIILNYLQSGDCAQKKNLQPEHPAEVFPRLFGVEKRANFIFSKWAKLIRKFGGPGDAGRKPFLLIFMVYLITVIILIFPLTWFAYQLQRLLAPKKLEKEARYFSTGE